MSVSYKTLAKAWAIIKIEAATGFFALSCSVKNFTTSYFTVARVL